MDSEVYINGLQSAINQPLGGKEIHFPMGGMSDVSGSSRLGGPYTPTALNVVLRAPYNMDASGGTRPGLKAFTGTQPVVQTINRWMWPNGDNVAWPSGDKVAFDDIVNTVIMPDGGVMMNQHETFNVKATKGSIPANCTSVAMYRARMVVAKDSLWYASRTSTLDDFDYGSDFEDASRPVAGNVALAGRKGESITALAPVTDSTLVIATKRGLWRIVGDVTQGMTLVSETIGIVSRHAWCFDGMRFWFIGANGLYSMIFGEPPSLMTPHLVDSLSGWTSAVLVYDAERRGIHVFGQDKYGTSTDWYYDIANSAAWPISYPATKRPVGGGLAMLNSKNRVVFQCADGVFRYWEESQATDDGTAIISAVALGPLTHTTGDTENAFLAELDCEMDESVTTNYGANLSLVVGKTSNHATNVSKSIVSWIGMGATGTFSGEKYRKAESAGWNHVIRPRIRCNSFSVVIWSLSNRWAMSKVTAVHRGCGRIR